MAVRRVRGRAIWRHASPFLIVAAFTAFPLAQAGADGTPMRPAAVVGLAPNLLGGPLRALKIATLDLPQPIGTDVPGKVGPGRQEAGSEADAAELIAVSAAAGPPGLPLAAAAGPRRGEWMLADILLEPRLLENEAAPFAEGASYGPDLGAPRETVPQDDAPAATAPQEGAGPDAFFLDPAIVFGSEPGFLPGPASGPESAKIGGVAPELASLPDGAPAAAPFDAAEEENPQRDGIWPSPAQRLGLAGEKLARAQKCLAEAIYFESRGETKRGQIAVAQVVVNRVFSGYYPNDVCGAVYQNANRHLACQFTFACDNVRDVVREPDMWVQAREIASDMLDGKLWLTSVGRATHYHAYWVHPSWVREMRKLDRIGVHTFYRPRRWGEG